MLLGLVCSLCLSLVSAENTYLFIAPKVVRPGYDLTIHGSLLVTPPSPVTVTVELYDRNPSGEQPPPDGPPFLRPLPMPVVQARVEPMIVDAVLPVDAAAADAAGIPTTEAATETTTTTTTTTTEPPPTPIATVTEVFIDDKAKIITLPIPENLQEPPRYDYFIKIKGTGGLEFENTTRGISYQEKSSTILIQTDKAIYKPGQTVHFRVLGLTPELQVILDDMKIDVFDPSGNKINQWDVSTQDLTVKDGVYQGDLLMSTEPIMGDWKIKVSLGREKTEKTFTVEEYVLPKFEVSIELPPFGRAQDKQFEGKVTAKYTFGKSVKGLVNLRVKPKWERYSWKDGKRTKISKEMELKFPIDGTATFTIPMKQLKDVQTYMDRSYFVFEANVTESLTRSKMSAEAELQFFERPIKIEFPSALPSTFKPGMEYKAVLKVSEQDDSPPRQVEGPVTITITHYTPPVTTTTTTTTSTTTTTPIPEKLVLENGTVIDVVVEKPIQPVRIIDRGGWWDWPRDVANELPEQNYTVPADGIIEVPLTIPINVIRVSIQARYKEERAYKSIKKSHSPSDNYIQLKLMAASVKAGDVANIEIKSTEPSANAIYQVMSKGKIVDSGAVDLSSGTFPLTVTANMAPKAKVIVFYIRPDGEVVADGLSFNVDGMYQNEVSVSFNQTQAEPADKIKLMVKADPGSKVNILGVDKSVLLLKSGNDFTNEQIKSELESYDSGGGFHVCDWFCWRHPISTGGQDTKSVFRNAGLVYLTDALVYQYEEPYPRPMPMAMARGGGMMMFAAAAGPGPRVMEKGGRRAPPAKSELAPVKRVRKLFPETWLWKTVDTSPRPVPMLRRVEGGPGPVMFDGAQQMNVAMIDTAGPPPKSELAPVTHVRKIFPETWLWKTLDTSGPDGYAELVDTVPDTITSWVVTAFAVNRQTGFGLSPAPANLQTFMPFFVSLHLPYSVTRGEKVIVQANVFNYTPLPLFAYVLMQRNLDYENIHISSWWTSSYSADVARFLKVEPNESKAVYFPIIPRKIGKIMLKVRAQSIYIADALEKELLVKPEGTPKETNTPVLIDLKKQPTFNTKVDINFPPFTVSGSQRVRVTAIGDLMGPSINGLDDLLKMPYGCGEQNMLNFAPNIFITRYLEITNNLDEATMEKSKGFMVKGYQRELRYQHDDGSFSAFGNSDPSGSMWLSAFVLKSFVQAKPYIFVSDDVIHRTIDWIVKHQNDNGTFREPGKVLHKEMQGGSTAGETSLTAFVLVSLLEARIIEGVQDKIASTTLRALQFLENEVPKMDDVYELAISSYALKLADSPVADTVLTKLMSKSKLEDGKLYWSKKEKPSTPTEVLHNQDTGKAINIELTSYALLTVALNNNTDDGLQVLKWLISKRNPRGGFSSTQDTIIALQGLSEMAAQIYSRDFDMTVTVTGPSGSGVVETFSITADNALILQSRDLPSDLGEVQISATGRGLSLVEVATFYNIDNDDQKPSFYLKVTVPEETLDEFKLLACTSWLEKGSSNMAVLEIGIPTGFAADKQSVTQHPLLKRTEDGEDKIILYFDEIPTSEVCITVDMQRSGLVAGAQPVPVRVYDYYAPDEQTTKFYVPEALRKSDVCEVCGKECDFCNRNAKPWFLS